jgi:hypothetical protein
MEENRITPATLAAAERLGMDPEKLADILDVYAQECAREATAGAAVAGHTGDDTAHREPVNPCTRGHNFCGQHGYDCPPDTRTLTRDNADEIAAWVGGWRAGGAYELVGWGPRGGVVYAHPGDTVVNIGGGMFVVKRGSEQQ